MKPWLFGSFVAVAVGWIFWLVIFVGGEPFPEKIPIHWNIAMEPDGWASGDNACAWLAFAPAMMTFLTCLGAALPWLMSKSPLDALTRNRLDFVLFAMSFFLLSLNVQLFMAMRSGELPVQLFLGSLFVLFGAVGWAMHGIPPNPVIGVRLPWTMNDARVWKKTHDFTSRFWIAGASFGVGAVAFGAPPMVCLILLLVVVFVPLAASIYFVRTVSR